MTSRSIPAYFAGATTTTARRVAARILLDLPGAALAGAVIGIQLLSDQLEITVDASWVVPCCVVLGLWLLINVAVLVFQSRTIPAAMLGFEYRSIRNGRYAGGRALAGRLITTLLVYASAGIMGIVLAAAHQKGQSLVDRWLGVVAVNPKLIRRAPQPAAPAAAAPAMAPAPPGPGGPASPARVTLQLPPDAPAAAPTAAQQRPAGPRPTAGPAGSPPQPAPSAPFGPPGLAATPPHPPAQPVPGQPAPAQSVDETELDANLALQARAGIRLDDGTVLALDRPVVLGRNPIAPDGFPGAGLVDLQDPSMKMSKTHVVVAVEEEKVKVEDIGARNGVVFEMSGTRVKIPPQQLIEVPPGATVHVGGRSFWVVS
jgi:PREDICTED: hypothetical protein